MKINMSELVKSFDENLQDTLDTATQVVKMYTKDLDICIEDIKNILNQDDMCIDDLNYYICYIPVLLYELNTTLQQLGIKTDAAKMQRKEMFNTTYNELDHGTVQYKTSYAQQVCQEEQMIEDIFTRIYKECEGKMEIAVMLHGSLKKILNYKTAEFEITRDNRNSNIF